MQNSDSVSSTASTEQPPFDTEKLIQAFLAAGGKSPEITPPITANQLKFLLTAVRHVFRNQPIFLRLKGPLVVCGDIHGQYDDLLRIFRYGGVIPKSTYLFLGDYVDRGRNSIETIVLLLLYKYKYPESLYLLRGNHECEAINQIYGFYDELNRRYPGGQGVKIWKQFQVGFNCFWLIFRFETGTFLLRSESLFVCFAVVKWKSGFFRLTRRVLSFLWGWVG